ncbi:nucleotidyltransferase family protein [Sphingomicrobium sp. XHP0239]|uniref:nucleotidyltransferase family protein n=1 Tax=Sphingomicrobium maritimum TaxID=3133972 RepID=UPI0031CCCBCF
MGTDGKVALVLLAAGQSRRFGADKLRAPLGDSDVLTATMESGEYASFDARYIVVPSKELVIERPVRWQSVVNREAESGMASSIRAGVRAASGHERIVIALADMPFVSAQHLDQLGNAGGVIFTRQQDGRPGSPAAFPRHAFSRLLQLHGDRGAAALDWPYAALMDPDDGWELKDIDEPADLVAANRRPR